MSGPSEKLLIQYDEMIRKGQANRVREELSRQKQLAPARQDLVSWAAIARRAGLPALALKLLQPIVRPKHVLKEPASPLELATYASALSRIGAIDEAMNVLKSIRVQTSPEVQLYTAFGHIQRWEYAKAIPYLKSYTSLPGVHDYDRLVGKLNLAGAYQFTTTQSREKERLIEDVVAEARKNNWHRLQKNAFELGAQAAMSASDWKGAESYLTEARSLSEDDDFYIRKWSAILRLRKDGRSHDGVEDLERLRQEALARRQFETVRECDFYRAMFLEDQALANHVYFGTPYPSYRENLKKALAWANFPEAYVWQINGEAGDRIFDLAAATERGSEVSLKPGSILHRLLDVLVSDFYTPFHIGRVFSRLYSDEVFNPFSSPSRVHRVVERLREWLNESSIPMEIKSEDLSFRLQSTGCYAIEVTGGLGAGVGETHREQLLQSLKENWSYKRFSTKEAALHLKMSEGKARELLKWAHAQGKVRVDGQGRATRFHF